MKQCRIVCKGWAFVQDGEDCVAFGNGEQLQYPIFPTRKEALSWKNDPYYGDRQGRIVRVVVSEHKILKPSPSKNAKRMRK